ncbi:hypothetical protein Pcinc_017540 [Petrolisthes cinctipes]|uniref:ER-bound oxygenase mpaB/mpaB'/Rubber oxygenase catalytic domain-containing protein n=1 Tax=Petrolisthes cinctipes TaxID=88211 RepID=A0AAE1FP21_PETCI|nr:hypothetical protein Pcinc_017540 [Petrolisthes cinctipes]
MLHKTIEREGGNNVSGVTWRQHRDNTREPRTTGTSPGPLLSSNSHSFPSPQPPDSPHLVSLPDLHPSSNPLSLCPILLSNYSALALVHNPPHYVPTHSSQESCQEQVPSLNCQQLPNPAFSPGVSLTQTYPPPSFSMPISPTINPSFASSPPSSLSDSCHNTSLPSSRPYIAPSPSSYPVHPSVPLPSKQHSSPTMPHLNDPTSASSVHHFPHHVKDYVIVHSATSLSRQKALETTKIFPGASPQFKQLMEGSTEPGDSGNPTEPPPWLDRELFNRGRDFYRRYLFCLSFSALLSLVLLMPITRTLNPLIYTGKSDTPYKALRRYMSTFLHLIMWFKGDVWDPNDPAHKDLLSVRRTHDRIARNINTKDYEKVLTMTVEDKDHEEPKIVLHPVISHDFSAATNYTLPEADPNTTFLSQMDMSLTQYSFMGLLLAHPEKIGAASATEEDFEGLVHFWRGLGWLLGIEDKFNFCRGTVQETRALSIEAEKFLGIPALASATWSYEHMSSCVINGIGYALHIISYPAMLRYLAYTIDVPIPNVVKHMTLRHTCKYWFMRLAFGAISLAPWLLGHFNKKLDMLMEHAKTSSKLKISTYRTEQDDVVKTKSTCPFR